MWQFLKQQGIPPNMSEVDYIRLTEEREAFRKEIRDLKSALIDATEEAKVWRTEAMKHIAR